MDKQLATQILQEYLAKHRSGTVELNSKLMLQELPYAVEVVLEQLLGRSTPEPKPAPELTEEQKKQRNRIADILNGKL